MMLLSLDPASTITGYAVFDGPTPDNLVESGRLVSDAKQPLLPVSTEEPRPEWLAVWYQEQVPAAYSRTLHLIRMVDDLISEIQPTEIVIEVSSGRAGTGSKRGAKSSLAIYGMAVGAIWEACCRRRTIVVPVTERLWTAGQGDKATRQIEITLCCRDRYNPIKDPGADAADAIGLGLWWLGRRRIQIECGEI